MVRVCVVIVLTETIAPTVLIASAQVPFAADHVVVIEQQHDFGDHRGHVDQQRHVVVIEGRGPTSAGTIGRGWRADGMAVRGADLVSYSGCSVLNLEVC